MGKVLTAREAASGFVANFPTALQRRCLFSAPPNIPTPFPPSINLGYWFFLASQAILLVLAGFVGTVTPDHRNRSRLSIFTPSLSLAAISWGALQSFLSQEVTSPSDRSVSPSLRENLPSSPQHQLAHHRKMSLFSCAARPRLLQSDGWRELQPEEGDLVWLRGNWGRKISTASQRSLTCSRWHPFTCWAKPLGGLHPCPEPCRLLAHQPSLRFLPKTFSFP